MGFIYKITNAVSGSVYIGQTSVEDPYERFKAHLSNARRGVGCPALTDAIISYGEDKFKFQVLIICLDQDIDEYEKEYILKYNSLVPNGYNILEGGQGGGGFKGKKHRQDVIEKISQKLKKRYENIDERKNLSDRAKKYYQNNPEARKKTSESIRNSEKWQKAKNEGRIGQGWKDKKHTEETKEKISQGLKRYYQTSNKQRNNTESNINVQKHRESMAKAVGVKVSKFTLDNVFIESFNSISEAARSLSVTQWSISRALKDPSYTACGFKWKKISESTRNTKK